MYTVRREEFKRHAGGINGLGGRFMSHVAFSVFSPQGKRAMPFEVTRRMSEDAAKAAAEAHAKSLNEFYRLRPQQSQLL